MSPKGKDDGDVPSRSVVARIVHRAFPPPRPSYGSRKLGNTVQEPKGVRGSLYKLFPPPLQTDIPWYTPSLTPKITEHGDFYQSYIGLETDDLINHVHKIRDQVWSFAPYPCIGRGWFLLPGLSGMKEWPEVVQAAKEGKTILDLGCGLGQDLRRLYSDAGGDAASLKLYASDVDEKMWEMGCKLFRDQKKPGTKFLCANAQDLWEAPTPGASFGPGGRLEEISGKVDVILTSQLLDLFFWAEQRYIGKTIVRLSHVGTKVIGRALGAAQGQSCEVSRDGDDKPMRMYHDAQSFKNMWWEFGNDSKTSWRIEVEEVDFEQWGLDQGDIAWLDEPLPNGVESTLKGLDFVAVRES